MSPSRSLPARPSLESLRKQAKKLARDIAAGDAGAIADLLGASALPLDGALACLESAVVAKAEGRVVGCAALELYGPDALLRSVAVDETMRRGGLGRRLAAAALDLASSSGASTVYLLTTTAEAFFHHLGFRTRADKNENAYEHQEGIYKESANHEKHSDHLAGEGGDPRGHMPLEPEGKQRP